MNERVNEETNEASNERRNERIEENERTEEHMKHSRSSRAEDGTSFKGADVTVAHRKDWQDPVLDLGSIHKGSHHRRLGVPSLVCLADLRQ